MVRLPSKLLRPAGGKGIHRHGVFVSGSIFKGPSVRGSLAQTGLKVHVSGGFKRPSRWSCVGKEPDGSTYPTFLVLLLPPPTCLSARLGPDTKMDFPSLFLFPMFHPPFVLPPPQFPSRGTNRSLPRGTR